MEDMVSDVLGPYYIEELIAAVLAVGIAIALLGWPEVVYRLQFFTGRPDTGRRGPYGEDGPLSTRMRRIVRLIGVVFLVFAVVVLALPHL